MKRHCIPGVLLIYLFAKMEETFYHLDFFKWRTDREKKEYSLFKTSGIVRLFGTRGE
jgi:hypothetical protein